MKNRDNIDKELSRIMKGFNSDFEPFFETRLMAKIEQLNQQSSAVEIYNLFFKRLFVTSITAIAAMLIITLILNGGLSIDAVLGIENLGVEKAIAMSITEF